MTVFKKIIAVMLCVVMLACAVASCDQNKDDAQSSETAKELQSSESTTETSAKTSEATTKDTESSKETESDTEKDDSNQNGTHVHNYNVKSTNLKYLKSEAFYDIDNAVYYYSCECGEEGYETFKAESDWVEVQKTVYSLKREMTVFSRTSLKDKNITVPLGCHFNVISTNGEMYKAKYAYSDDTVYVDVKDTTDNIGMVTFTNVGSSSIEVEDPRENVILYSDLGITKAFEVDGYVAIGAFSTTERIKVTAFNQTRDFLEVTYVGYDSEYNYHALETYYCHAKGISIWYNDDDLKFN